MCQHRTTSQVSRAQIRAVKETGKWSQLQIQSMFGICSRGLAKVLENSSKGTDKGNPVNDSELLSPEFATALATGKTNVIKKFVENHDDERNSSTTNKTIIAESSPTEASSTKKNVPSANGRLMLASTSRSFGAGEALSRKGKANTEGVRTESMLLDEKTKLALQRAASKRNTLPEASISSTPTSTSSSSGKGDTLSRNGEENTREFFAELRSLSRQGGKPAITIPPIGKSLTLIPSPKDNTQPTAQAANSPTTTHPINPLPIPPAINNAFPSTSTNSLTTEAANVHPPLPPSSHTVSSQQLSAGASESHSSLEPRTQNSLLPAAANSHEIEAHADQHAFDAVSVTLKSESRDPTPEVEEVSALRNANPDLSPIRLFLSNLQPPLAQYAPRFEKLGVKNSDELLILKGLAPASIRESCRR
ncbi:hypothetical protein FS837_001139 [Tulasnella sp. UAMH 9824]|nr:hypothetical protein FS837_001139 [Tulasnella sp. UAMH 9824]